MEKIIIFLLGILLLSCKKDLEPLSEVKYILPGKYFPVYPGSTWTYIENDGDTIIHSSDANWQKHSYKVNAFNDFYTDPVYVPKFEGKFIYGYSSYNLGQSNYSPFTQILSENLGESWLSNWVLTMSGWINTGNSVVDTTLYTISVPAGTFVNVIKVNEYENILGTGDTVCYSKYYVPDVGIIRVDYFMNSVYVSDYMLLSFYINN